MATVHLELMSSVVITCANVNRPLSLMKASTLGMSSSVGDVDGRPDWFPACPFRLKAFYSLIHLSLIHGVLHTAQTSDDMSMSSSVGDVDGRPD